MFNRLFIPTEESQLTILGLVAGCLNVPLIDTVAQAVSNHIHQPIKTR